MIRVELSAIVINERSDEQVIALREVEGERQFPIVIGMFEAFAIDRIVKGRESERPLTHDLLASLVGALGGRVVRVAIDDLRDETYYAKVVVRRGDDDEVLVDARPSDAITLALKVGVPIYVAERVMNAAAPG
ncbi:MAG: bifunctional nuclease family protein [Planctomycetota bacterium]|nr:bifunctional nuclease family protein [Planctomycetota bacterium]